MCAGDDHNCPQFELHRQKLLDELDSERRSFLKSAFVASGSAAAAWAAGGTLATPASAQGRPGQPTYHYLPATADTVPSGAPAVTTCTSAPARNSETAQVSPLTSAPTTVIRIDRIVPCAPSSTSPSHRRTFC